MSPSTRVALLALGVLVGARPASADTLYIKAGRLFRWEGRHAQELERMVRYGMRPADALRSATSVAAQLLGVGDITGTIEPGRAADIIAVPGNPLEDITVMQRVSFVMKEGAVFLEPVGGAVSAYVPARHRTDPLPVGEVRQRGAPSSDVPTVSALPVVRCGRSPGS